MEFKNDAKASAATGGQVIDRRFTLIAILALVLIALPLAAGAQQAQKPYRISFLGLTPAEDVSPTMKAFRERLRELGYIEGKNLIFEYRSAEGRAPVATSNSSTRGRVKLPHPCGGTDGTLVG